MTVEENNTWKIPSSWKSCNIFVFGEPSTNVNLVEHPIKNQLCRRYQLTRAIHLARSSQYVVMTKNSNFLKSGIDYSKIGFMMNKPI